MVVVVGGVVVGVAVVGVASVVAAGVVVVVGSGAVNCEAEVVLDGKADGQLPWCLFAAQQLPWKMCSQNRCRS